MKGFDIWLNDKKFSIAVVRGVIVIYIDKSHISISGIDSTKGLTVSWGKFETKTNDQIKINTVNVEESDVPIKIEYIDRQELFAQYLSLKEMLIKEGVLK